MAGRLWRWRGGVNREPCLRVAREDWSVGWLILADVAGIGVVSEGAALPATSAPEQTPTCLSPDIARLRLAGGVTPSHVRRNAQPKPGASHKRNGGLHGIANSVGRGKVVLPA